MNDATQTTTPLELPRRRHRLRFALLAAAIAVVGGFVAIYVIFFTGSSPPPLHLSTPAETTATTGGSATTALGSATSAAGQPQSSTTLASNGSLDGTWAVGASSVAGYRVREKLASLPAQSDAVGRTSAITGSIAVSHQGDQLVVASGAMFSVDVTKLVSNEAMRDNRIRTMGLESNRFPTATFVSSAAISLPASASSGGDTKTQVTGSMTIHGVTKTETISLDTQVNGGRIEVVGSLSFPWSEFGMTKPDIGGFVTVTDTATIEFQLFFDHK